MDMDGTQSGLAVPDCWQELGCPWRSAPHSAEGCSSRVLLLPLDEPSSVAGSLETITHHYRLRKPPTFLVLPQTDLYLHTSRRDHSNCSPGFGPPCSHPLEHHLCYTADVQQWYMINICITCHYFSEYFLRKGRQALAQAALGSGAVTILMVFKEGQMWCLGTWLGQYWDTWVAGLDDCKKSSPSLVILWFHILQFENAGFDLNPFFLSRFLPQSPSLLVSQTTLLEIAVILSSFTDTAAHLTSVANINPTYKVTVLGESDRNTSVNHTAYKGSI